MGGIKDKKKRKDRKGEGMTPEKMTGYNAMGRLQEAAEQINEAANDYPIPAIECKGLPEAVRADLSTAALKIQIALRWLERSGAQTNPAKIK